MKPETTAFLRKAHEFVGEAEVSFVEAQNAIGLARRLIDAVEQLLT